jgi:hypothetical protein
MRQSIFLLLIGNSVLLNTGPYSGAISVQTPLRIRSVVEAILSLFVLASVQLLGAVLVEDATYAAVVVSQAVVLMDEV